MTELLFRHGTVYTPDGPRQVEVHVTDGVIAAVEVSVHAPSAKVIDATGLYVLPGGVDVHVHSRDPGFPEKEDFGSLTAAAAAGGITAVLDMPNTVPAVDSAGVLEAKAALARSKAHVDFGLWGLVRATSTPEQLEELAAAGAVGFKAYLVYSFSLSRKQVLYAPDAAGDPDLEPPADYGTLARLAPTVARLGLPLAIHAEDPTVLAAFRRPVLTYSDLLESRPPEAEAVAVSAAAAVARESGAHLHIAHLSSALGLQAAEDAIRLGTSISLETCPQFLLLTDRDFDRLGATMKMLPPIRTEADRAALVDGVRRGVIGIVSTDHAPHTDQEKSRGFEEVPAGSPGVQTLYLSCLQLAKDLGDVWLAARWVSATPAVFAGLGDSKGAVAAGYDADLVLVDPRRKTRVAAAQMRSRQRHGVMEGMDFDFAIVNVYLRGESVAHGGRVHGRMVRPALVAT